jgi:hypothetical protein
MYEFEHEYINEFENMQLMHSYKKTIENNKDCCPALKDAVIKYGIENFIFTVLN